MPSDDERSTLLGSTPTDKTQQRDPKKAAPRPPPPPRKSTRFAPRTRPLESVSEESSPAAGPHEFFGVRSYVHTFYEAMAMDEPGRSRSTTPTNKSRRRDRRRRLLRCAHASGALLLLSGLCVLLVGHLVAKRREVVDVQEDIEVVSRVGREFNRRLDVCKVAGLALFCAGGVLTAAALAALAFCDRRSEEEEEEEEVSPVGGPDPGPGPPAVPVTEEVRAVQPGRTDVVVGCACQGRT